MIIYLSLPCVDIIIHGGAISVLSTPPGGAVSVLSTPKGGAISVLSTLSTPKGGADKAYLIYKYEKFIKCASDFLYYIFNILGLL